MLAPGISERIQLKSWAQEAVTGLDSVHLLTGTEKQKPCAWHLPITSQMWALSSSGLGKSEQLRGMQAHAEAGPSVAKLPLALKGLIWPRP